ncbi:TPA: hypothetical protein RTK63_005067 [Vibrio harveyi]|nr:hypothetical protein [Vibrio harveyi]
MNNLIQLKNETNPYNTIFYAIEWHGEPFKTIKTNLSYICYLRQLFDGDCGYEMFEEEMLYLYQMIFGTNYIIEPNSPLMKANSFLFTFVSAEYNVLDISNQELKHFIEGRKQASRDFDMMKHFIISNIDKYHPWHSLRPNASNECWSKEKQRIESLPFTPTL